MLIRSAPPTAVYASVRLLTALLNSEPIGPAEAWQLLRACADQIGLLQDCTLLWAWLCRVAQEGTFNEWVPCLVRVTGEPTVVAARCAERDRLLPGLHPTYTPPTPPDSPPPALRSAAFDPTTSYSLKTRSEERR